MFKYIFPFVFAPILFLIGVFVAGNFEWQTWDEFGKVMLVLIWAFVSVFLFFEEYTRI